jgi:hypothetical protein
VTLTDHDVDFFDVTRTADVDINAPLEERNPGGLGLHLIKKMVEFFEYQYLEESRTSRITFRCTRGTAPQAQGQEHARNRTRRQRPRARRGTLRRRSARGAGLLDKLNGP